MPIGKEKWIVHVIWLLTSKTPERQLWGFLFPFLVVGLSPQAHYWLYITVQPFDDVMANYTTHNSDNKRSEKIHVIHLLPVASMEAVTLPVYHILFWASTDFSKVLLGARTPSRRKKGGRCDGYIFWHDSILYIHCCPCKSLLWDFQGKTKIAANYRE